MDNLVQLNQSGLFPAPGQSDQVFWAKVDYVSMRSTLGGPLPATLGPMDVQPCWVPIQSSNEGMHLWEGAVLWQSQTDAGFMLPQIQISQRAQRFYSKEELIAHEIVHAVRIDFKEEEFEEVLAYASSPKAWRRWIGPFFRNPREATLFIWAMVLSIAMQGVELATGLSSGWLLIPWVPALLIMAGLVRLMLTQRLFRRCLNNLSRAIKDPDQRLAVVLRLSDAEIRSFSRMGPEEIHDFVDKERKEQLRWKMLAAAYF
ncbi:MAG: hypothetical protein KF898_01195 [Parachlamydiales bacterium]|nr:hypothetical protein [Candidatus Acheromyda pituitae]